jgi:hypothetical protein
MTYFRRRIESDAVNVSGVRHCWVAILVPLAAGYASDG